ncbi:prolyl 3-hydroxylase 1 [Anomaloglossus baeobatrachus]|uniref:prolyl 3-hydroxylase 1 n=1 Tax=Anomaloglossus baeobatrachus TaxID=238106 RepID=UPI003F4FC914
MAPSVLLLGGLLLAVGAQLLAALLEPYDLLYDNGVQAYYREDWPSVILSMEKALRNRELLRRNRITCRSQCANTTDYSAQSPGWGPVQDLSFFQRVLERAHCVRGCERRSMGAPATYYAASEELELEFRKRSPYNYLQVAYFKIHKLDKAVAAAHTFFVGNPDHLEMRQNLEYYKVMAGVSDSDFRDLEAKPHMNRKTCCFHVTYCFICLISEDAFYRHASVWTVEVALCFTENYTKAIQCAKTYLLFHPNEQIMNQNLAYYAAVMGEGDAALIQPREDVQSYITRSLLEKELLYFAYDVFGIPFVDPDTWTPESVIPKRLKEKQKAERETAARISEEIGNLMKEIENLVEEKTKETFDLSKSVREGGPVLFDEVSVVMNSKTLNGSQRVVTDGVISEDECRELLRLTNAAASAGDGYRGTTSPHTPNEKFHGVTVYKALKLGQEGKVPLRSAHLFYNVTEKVRRVVESYFRLDSPLYFSYSHLVCRTAIEEKQDDRKDLSHPVHADNCVLKAEALVCVKEHPAYTFRDYSAILYLNGDFEGGHFYFTELDAKTITAEIKPECGRMVGFSSGAENPHGVKAVTKGQRCAVALWFTLDPRHNERERVQADDLIKMLFSPEETNVFPGNESDRKSETPSSEGDKTGGVVAPPELPTGPDSAPPKKRVLGPPIDSQKAKTEL